LFSGRGAGGYDSTSGSVHTRRHSGEALFTGATATKYGEMAGHTVSARRRIRRPGGGVPTVIPVVREREKQCVLRFCACFHLWRFHLWRNLLLCIFDFLFYTRFIFTPFSLSFRVRAAVAADPTDYASAAEAVQKGALLLGPLLPIASFEGADARAELHERCFSFSWLTCSYNWLTFSYCILLFIHFA